MTVVNYISETKVTLTMEGERNSRVLSTCYQLKLNYSPLYRNIQLIVSPKTLCITISYLLSLLPAIYLQVAQNISPSPIQMNW